MSSQSSGNDPTWLINGYVVTSNNNGTGVGIASEQSPAWSGASRSELVIWTPDPHTVTYTYTPPGGYPWQTATMQSPGYLNAVATTTSENTGQFQGAVAGINDHQSVALTEYTYPTHSPPMVQTPHLLPMTHASGDISLGTLGGTNGVANALNNSNQVVGWSQIASGAQHAYLYSNGTMQDLNSLIPSSSGFVLTSAVGIDSAGEIVAYGTNSSGQTNEYLLTPLLAPVPEPSTLVVMSLMIVAMVARRLRVRRLSNRE